MTGWIFEFIPMMSKMRTIAIEHFVSSIDRFDGSDNESMIVEWIDHSWVTRMIHHGSWRIDCRSYSILTIINDGTFVIIQISFTKNRINVDHFEIKRFFFLFSRKNTYQLPTSYMAWPLQTSWVMCFSSKQQINWNKSSLSCFLGSWELFKLKFSTSEKKTRKNALNHSLDLKFFWKTNLNDQKRTWFFDLSTFQEGQLWQCIGRDHQVPSHPNEIRG